MNVLRARWWIAAAALLALAPGVRLWRHVHQVPVLHAGDRLISLPLSSLNGSSYRFSPPGRPQLINVFATWCTPCRMEMPAFTVLAQRLRERGIDVVGIDQQESGGAVAQFAREFHVTYPLLIDSSGITHRVFGSRYIPTTIFVDRDGTIRWIHPGPLSEHDMTTLTVALKDAG